MRRALALSAAAMLLAAPAADAKPRAKPLRFAAKCTAKKSPCRSAKGWRAAPVAVGVVAAPAPPPAPSEAAAEQLAPAPAEQPGPAPAPPPAAPLCDPSPWLGAIAEDVDGFRLRLTRSCVPAGTVLFQFRNQDLAFHNLWAEGTEPARAPRQVVEDTAGETTVTRSAQLTAGEWRLYCSLPGHEAMTRLVDVTPAG